MRDHHPLEQPAVAKLIPVRLEIPTSEGYRWVDGYQVINPSGVEAQPFMHPNAARDLCKQEGWMAEVHRPRPPELEPRSELDELLPADDFAQLR